jgi:hypothetical protein
MGNREEAKKELKMIPGKYTNYSNESRLHFFLQTFLAELEEQE